MIRNKQHTEGLLQADINTLGNITSNKSFTKYTLYPIITQPPTITGQPIHNFTQTTWKEYNTQKVLINQDKRRFYLYDTVILAKNTTFSINIFASDPSNTVDPNSTSGLTFVWKRNGIVIETLQHLNTSVITVDKVDSQPSLSGIYTCDVTNQYGTTTTNPIRLKIVDLTKELFFNKNLVVNGSGDASTDGWTSTDKFTIQELSDYFSTAGFGSVNTKGNFKFSMDARLYSNTDIYSFVPATIANEHPSDKYASFFPSIYKVESPQYKLADKINNFHLGLDRVVYGQDQTVKATQLINIGDYYNYVDGGVYGVNTCGYEFFHYLGGGILNYEMNLNEVFPVNTRFPSTKSYPAKIKNISFKQIIDNETSGTLDFLNQTGELLERQIISGPSVRDITAITNKQVYDNDNIKSLFNIIPNRKIDFTQLSSRLIKKSGLINTSQIYFKLPILRVPNDGGVVFEYDQDSKRVTNVSASPANEYKINFGEVIVEDPLLGNIRIGVQIARRDIVLNQAIDPDDPDDDDSQSQTVITLKQRLIAMEVILDLITYGVDINENYPKFTLPADLLLGLYMTAITTFDTYTNALEKSGELYDTSLATAARLLELSVEHQADGANHTQNVGSIFRHYIRDQVSDKSSAINNIRDSYNAQYNVAVGAELQARLFNMLDNFSFRYIDDFQEKMTAGQLSITKNLFAEKLTNFAGDFDYTRAVLVDDIVVNKMDELKILTELARTDTLSNRDLSDSVIGICNGLRDQVRDGTVDIFTNDIASVIKSRNAAITQAMDLVWSDIIQTVSYISNDFRFKKLSTILNQLVGGVMFDYVYTALNENYIQSFYANERDKDSINVIIRSYMDQVMPIISTSEQELNAGYLKLLQYDILPENNSKLPFNVIPESEQSEIFFNNVGGRLYGSFAKGAAAFFGYNYTGSIPFGTRAIKLEYDFSLKNKNINRPQPEVWQSDQVTLDGYSVYSAPRVGVIGATLLIHPIQTYNNTFTQSLAIDPKNNWQVELDKVKFVPDDNLETVYNSSTAQINMLAVCNAKIKEYIGILPEMQKYFNDLHAKSPFIFGGVGEAWHPAFFKRDQIGTVDLSKYPFIDQLITRYQYLNLLSF